MSIWRSAGWPCRDQVELDLVAAGWVALERDTGGHETIRLTDAGCPMKPQCTPGANRRIRRWEHEAVLEAAQRQLDKQPNAMTLRRQTIEHVFGTLKHWMGSTHFLTRRLTNVSTEMSLHVLAYNFKRVLSILGISRTMKAMKFAGA